LGKGKKRRGDMTARGNLEKQAYQVKSPPSGKHLVLNRREKDTQKRGAIENLRNANWQKAMGKME